ncbi:hypothetical protein CCYN74_100135 [Capnocytophaga cynodegmi]|uniref:Uncharacterized protein n=1 Tax=Capnocytophaga cynodegmi TaxID=28189 RepID=A0A0B7H9S8_9FLAO|nr:hypothetical protein CCYN74_100135 [Capnocytophaga cynodegmi]
MNVHKSKKIIPTYKIITKLKTLYLILLIVKHLYFKITIFPFILKIFFNLYFLNHDYRKLRKLILNIFLTILF